MIVRKLIQDAGSGTWINVGPQVDGVFCKVDSMCITSTGRIIVGSTCKPSAEWINCGIWYSDDGGITWTQLKQGGNHFDYFCSTLTGRILAFGRIDDVLGIWYSDDDGLNWALTNSGEYYFRGFCVTATGRILTSRSYRGIWYSDDNGINWVQSNETEENRAWYSFYTMPTGRILAGSASGRGIWYSDDNGVNWTQSNTTRNHWSSFCVTPTGRIIACNCGYDGGNTSDDGYGIWYSDDNGINWTSPTYANSIYRYKWDCICITQTGRIIIGSGGGGRGVWYSDDDGLNWTLTNVIGINGSVLGVTPTGRVICSSSNGVWYSDPIYQNANYTSRPLTGKQAKELVQQCKAYVQSLKNGN